MKKVNLCMVILVFSYACGNSQGSAVKNRLEEHPGTLTEIQRQLIVDHLNMFPKNTEASFAILRQGEVSFYGVKHQEGEIRYAENYDRVFEIGSITKVFTATLLADFVISGQLKLDDTINRYLSTPLKNNVPITFRQLANHTSGLPRMPSNFGTAISNPDNPYRDYNEERLEQYLAEHLSLSPNPERKMEYSNLGAGLLAYTLGKISGKDYQELLDALIFKKYGMTLSTTKRVEVMNRLVKGLNATGNETSNWDLSALVGAGGILSSVEDLSKFAIAQFDTTNKELALTRTRTLTGSSGMDVGLGWIIKTNPNSEWHWHNGGTGGYRSCMVLDVWGKTGVIVLSNISASHFYSGKIDELCFALMKTLYQE